MERGGREVEPPGEVGAEVRVGLGVSIEDALPEGPALGRVRRRHVHDEGVGGRRVLRAEGDEQRREAPTPAALLGLVERRPVPYQHVGVPQAGLAGERRQPPSALGLRERRPRLGVDGEEPSPGRLRERRRRARPPAPRPPPKRDGLGRAALGRAALAGGAEVANGGARRGRQRAAIRFLNAPHEAIRRRIRSLAAQEELDDGVRQLERTVEERRGRDAPGADLHEPGPDERAARREQRSRCGVDGVEAGDEAEGEAGAEPSARHVVLEVGVELGEPAVQLGREEEEDDLLGRWREVEPAGEQVGPRRSRRPLRPRGVVRAGGVGGGAVQLVQEPVRVVVGEVEAEQGVLRRARPRGARLAHEPAQAPGEVPERVVENGGRGGGLRHRGGES